MSDQARNDKVNTWIDTIVFDVSEMLAQHHVFWKVVKIIGENSEIIATPFYYWLGESFKTSAAIAVRRIAEDSPKVIFLYKLFEELRKSPLLITRDYFVNHPVFFPNGPLSVIKQLSAHETFDKIVGEGKQHLERTVIDEDSKLLVAKAQTIKHYVDTHYAHRSKAPSSKPIPKLSDLDECLGCLKHLAGKYYHLIKGIPCNFDIHSDYFDDWHSIFKSPWITCDSGTTDAS